MNSGGPAFPMMYPVTVFDGDGNEIREEFPHPDGQQEGMTLRDYFAAKAMQAEVSSEDFGDGVVQKRSEPNARLMAERAYHLADAMLAEREKQS